MVLDTLLTEHKYDVVLADTPWPYSGSPTKPQAAGKHYKLLSEEQVLQLPVRRLLAKRAIVYVWATGPKLALACRAGEAWGLHFRGQAFVWVKTTKAGKIIHGQGVKPTTTKPTTECVLVFSTVATGRPLPVLDMTIGQVVLAPRGAHSQKPDEVQRRIELLHGPVSRLELFARRTRDGWDSWGDGVGSSPWTP